jgi:hypothetical protein
MEVTTEPTTTGRINEVKTEDRSLDGIGRMLASSIKQPEEVKKEIPQSAVDALVKGLETKGAVEVKPEEVVAEKVAEVQVDAAPAVAEKHDAAPIVTDEVKIEPNFWETEEPVSEDKKQEAKAKDIKDLESKAKQYDEIINDKFYNAYKSAKEAGKDVTTFLSEIQGQDPSKLSLDQLMMEQLKSENLSPDAIAKEMEDFNELSERAKIRETKDVKARLIKEQENRLGQYATDNQASQERFAQIGKKAQQEKEQYLEGQKGKKVMGIEMTPTLTNELNDFYENFNITREDGSIDVPRIMQLGLLEKKSKIMLQNAYSKGKTDAELAFYKTHARPSKDNGIAVVPEVKNKSQQSETQKNLAEFDRLTQIRGRGDRVSN